MHQSGRCILMMTQSPNFWGSYCLALAGGPYCGMVATQQCSACPPSHARNRGGTVGFGETPGCMLNWVSPRQQLQQE
jgi:hypothetical protein